MEAPRAVSINANGVWESRAGLLVFAVGAIILGGVVVGWLTLRRHR